MNLLATERIKLLSVRSSWWCLALVIIVSFGMTALFLSLPDVQAGFGMAQIGLTFGQAVIMVLAAIAVTSEYRFGTIRVTFTAVPNRTAVLVAKTAVMTVLAAVVGLAAAFIAWGLAYLGAPVFTDLALSSSAEWRAVAGQGLVYGLVAIFAMGVGLLVRHTAGAISILLVWWLVVEQLILQTLTIFDVDIVRWMPFANAANFLSVGDVATGTPAIDYPFGPWGSITYFAVIAIGLLVIGIVSVNRRDA